jgi:hypothetical protein
MTEPSRDEQEDKMNKYENNDGAKLFDVPVGLISCHEITHFQKETSPEEEVTEKEAE